MAEEKGEAVKLSKAQRETLEKMAAGKVLVRESDGLRYYPPPPFNTVYPSTLEVLIKNGLAEEIPPSSIEKWVSIYRLRIKELRKAAISQLGGTNDEASSLSHAAIALTQAAGLASLMAAKHYWITEKGKEIVHGTTGSEVEQPEVYRIQPEQSGAGSRVQ